MPGFVIYTVEPLIKDPPRKGHCMLDFSTRDTDHGPKDTIPHSFCTLRTSEKRTTSLQVTKWLDLYCSQSVLCLEVPL